MTSSNTSKGKRSAYRIVPMRGVTYVFDIKSQSPEKACERLHERLKRDAGLAETYKEPHDAAVFGHSWFPPEEVGYLISGGDLPEDPTGKTCHVWNGTKIVRMKISRNQ